MVDELKKSIQNGKVLFGMKESLKNDKKLEKVFVSSDARESTLFALRNKNINFDFLDMTKREISEKLEIGFFCEIFGLKK